MHSKLICLECHELGNYARLLFHKYVKYITYLGQAVTVKCSKMPWAAFQISDVELDPESAKCKNVEFRQLCKSVIGLVFLSIKIWNITRFLWPSGHVRVTIYIGQTFKYYVSNSAQKPTLTSDEDSP